MTKTSYGKIFLLYCFICIIGWDAIAFLIFVFHSLLTYSQFLKHISINVFIFLSLPESLGNTSLLQLSLDEVKMSFTLPERLCKMLKERSTRFNSPSGRQDCSNACLRAQS